MNDIPMKTLQAEVSDWVNKNFPNQAKHHPLLGAVEELGELCHSHLKNEQNIRISENHRENIEDAIADIVVFLAAYCAGTGFCLQSAINKTWPKVKNRDWIKNKVNGE